MRCGYETHCFFVCLLLLLFVCFCGLPLSNYFVSVCVPDMNLALFVGWLSDMVCHKLEILMGCHKLELELFVGHHKHNKDTR